MICLWETNESLLYCYGWWKNHYLLTVYPDVNIVGGKRLNDATESDIREWIEKAALANTNVSFKLIIDGKTQ